VKERALFGKPISKATKADLERLFQDHEPEGRHLVKIKQIGKKFHGIEAFSAYRRRLSYIFCIPILDHFKCYNFGKVEFGYSIYTLVGKVILPKHINVFPASH